MSVCDAIKARPPRQREGGSDCNALSANCPRCRLYEQGGEWYALRMRCWAGSVPLSIFLACSGGSGGTTDGAGASPGNSVASGSVGGASPQLVSAVASYQVITLASVRGLVLVLSSASNTCTASPGRSFTQIQFQVPGSPVAPGSYTIINGIVPGPSPIPLAGQALGSFAAVNNCMAGADEYATSGVLTLTASDAARVAGTFDLTFRDGHVAGHFDAPICAVDAGATVFGCP